MPFNYSLSNTVKNILQWVTVRYLSVIFITSMLFHIYLIFARFLPRESLKYFSADENNLLRAITRYQGHLLNLDFSSFFTERLDAGYGYLFYSLSAILTLPLYALGGDMGVLAGGRLIASSLEAGTIVLICYLFRFMGASIPIILLTGIVMSFMPGLMVIHKPLSAEQWSNFLVVLAAFLVFRQSQMDVRSRIFLISLTVSAAVSIKLNAALQGIFFAAGVIWLFWKFRLADGQYVIGTREFFGVAVKDILAAVAGLSLFFVFNLPLLLSSSSRDGYIYWIKRQLASNKNSHLGRTPYDGIEDWAPQVGVYFGGFIPIAMLIATMVVALLVCLILKVRRECFVPFLALSLVWVLVPSAYVILSVKKVWMWYLVLPGFLLFSGAISLNAISRSLGDTSSLRRGLRVALNSLSVFVILFIGFRTWPGFKYYSSHRWAETTREDFREIEIISDFVMNDIKTKGLALPDVSIVVDPYTTLPLDKFKSEGSKVRVKLAAELSVDDVKSARPDYIVMRYWTYAQSRGDREGTMTKVKALLDEMCDAEELCYSLSYDGKKSLTHVFSLRNKA